MTRTRSAIGRQNRARGQAFEREVAKLLRAVWPDAERNIAQARTAKREGCDVEGTPWWVECKSGRGIDWRSALEQAERDTDGRRCVVIGRERGKRVLMVCLRYLSPFGSRPCVRMTLGDWMLEAAGARPADVLA